MQYSWIFLLTNLSLLVSNSSPSFFLFFLFSSNPRFLPCSCFHLPPSILPFVFSSFQSSSKLSPLLGMRTMFLHLKYQWFSSAQQPFSSRLAISQRLFSNQRVIVFVWWIIFSRLGDVMCFWSSFVHTLPTSSDGFTALSSNITPITGLVIMMRMVAFNPELNAEQVKLQKKSL